MKNSEAVSIIGNIIKDKRSWLGSVLKPQDRQRIESEVEALKIAQTCINAIITANSKSQKGLF
jgi:hypothetical protein